MSYASAGTVNKRKRFESGEESLGGEDLLRVPNSLLPLLRTVCGYAKDHNLVRNGVIHTAEVRTHVTSCLQDLTKAHAVRGSIGRRCAYSNSYSYARVLDAVDALSSAYNSDFSIACPTVG